MENDKIFTFVCSSSESSYIVIVLFSTYLQESHLKFYSVKLENKCVMNNVMFFLYLFFWHSMVALRISVV